MAEELEAFDGWPTWDSLRSTVWEQSTWRRLRAGVQLVVTLAALLTLAGGTPVLLLRWGGWPLTELPGRELIERLPLTSASQQLVLVLIGLAAWGGWAAFVVGVCGQLATATRRPKPGHRPRDGSRPLAQRLVDSAAASLVSLRTGAEGPAPRPSAGRRPADTDALPDGSLIEALGKLIGAGGNGSDDPPAHERSPSDSSEGPPTTAERGADGPSRESEDGSRDPDTDATRSDDQPAEAKSPDAGASVAGRDGHPPGEASPDTASPDVVETASDGDDPADPEPDDAGVDPAADDPPVRTTTAVVSSAGHLTLSPWRIGVGTRWTGTRVTVVQKGLHVEIYDPEDRLIRSLDIDPDRRYQPSRSA